MTARFSAIPTETARHYQSGGLDANGQIPERANSDGNGNPCRHCLDDIPAGTPMLILAHRPFPALQPYAELGPIFLCAEPCRRWEGEGLPPVLSKRARHLIKGYNAQDRIAYGTGRVVETSEIAEAAAAMFEDPRVAYGHVRSDRNNCFTCRIDSV